MGDLYMTPKQLKFLYLFRTRVAPQLSIAPSAPGVPELLRGAAVLHQSYFIGGEDAFRARADELLQLDKPGAVKIIELAAELALTADLMGDDLSEAAKHTLWLADALEHLFPHKQEK